MDIVIMGLALVFLGVVAGFVTSWMERWTTERNAQFHRQQWHTRQETVRQYLEARAQEYYQWQAGSTNSVGNQ